MTSQQFFGRVADILAGPRPDCESEDCQQAADWLAVAPSMTIATCADHLGGVLGRADPLRHVTWFLHPFDTESRRRPPIPM
jgi:hypothetical protein